MVLIHGIDSGEVGMRRIWWIVGGAVGTMALCVGGPLVYFQATAEKSEPGASPRVARVGDCLGGPVAPVAAGELRQVSGVSIADCSSDTAQYRVMGRIEQVNDYEVGAACSRLGDWDFVYTQMSTGRGLALCLVDKKFPGGLAAAKVGSCFTEVGPDDLKPADCAGVLADWRLVGRIESVTVGQFNVDDGATLCSPFAATGTAVLGQRNDGSRYALCLEAVDKE